jgi:hypothetical protein
MRRRAWHALIARAQSHTGEPTTDGTEDARQRGGDFGRARPPPPEATVSVAVVGSRPDWSLTALGLASIAMTFIEPDPSVVWNEGRLTTVRQAFESLEAPAV